MNLPKATKKSAFIAGIWTGSANQLLSSLFASALLEYPPELPVFLIVAIVSLVPALPFIFEMPMDNSDSFRQRLKASFDSLVRSAKRGLLWLVGGFAAGSFWYLVLSF